MSIDKLIHKKIDIFSCPHGDCPIEVQFKNAIEIANLGLWEWDVVTNEIIFSEEVYKIAGIKKEMFDNTLESIINHFIHDDSKEKFISSLKSVYNNGTVHNDVYRVNHPSKDQCWVRFRSKITFDLYNHPIKVIGVIMDVTEEFMVKRQLEEDLEFRKMLMELIPNPIFYKNFQGKYKYFNSAFEDYLGLTYEELFDKSVYDIAPKKLAEIYDAADKELMTNKGKQVYETKVQFKDKSIRDVIFRKSVHTNDHNESIGMIGLMEDITDLRQMQVKLTMLSQVKELFIILNNNLIHYLDERSLLIEAVTALKDIFECIDYIAITRFDDVLKIEFSDGVIMNGDIDQTDYHEIISWYNKKFEINSVNLIRNDDLLGKEIEQLASVLNRNTLKNVLTIPIISDEKCVWTLCFASKSECLSNMLYQEVASYIVEQMSIMFNVFKLYKRTIYMSRYDGLTGLMNRVYLDEMLEKTLEAAKGKTVYIVMFDLDNLKKINDSYGHAYGDQLIIRFKELLVSSFNENAYFGRVGGDEFIGVFRDIELQSLETCLKSLRINFMEEESLHNIKINGSFSYGIASYPEDGDNLKIIIKTADKRMYEDKKQNMRTHEIIS